ncbi:MAG: hypothetical protein RR996_06780 [Alistipes sp.]
MDNFSDILWILIIGGSAVISFVMEGKKKKHDKEMPDATTTPQAEPLEERRIEPVLRNLTDILEQALPKHNAKSPRTPKHAKTPSTSTVGAVPVSSMTGANSVAEQSAVATQPTEGIMSDFDLRKAVIWSEILKPKFNDEESF